ncbi:DNA cytosine methyltransferase [Halorubrum sp. 48-1-W]|uniref:DNA cytosine methyltransferase n=1 Tax=Halorubrum sp. 48-1-W TaxID=2249761 RepID=UPI000DCCA88B|nr:DNA cytosine methyltransferase [Halorubrum sp. 48-1-W]RAW44077.1 DNA cytosine methyltransferase [Halorubrum sp. 48-1-W]
MTEYAVLDLFAGLGGFSQAFADSERWEVTTVEIDARFEPDIQADVFELRPSDFETEFDVVLASPPCTQFSIAASSLERFVGGEPQTDDARDAVALVYHTLGLIRGLNPQYWFVENPQGYLRQIIGEPTARVTYCQYGTEYMKPTDLWGEHPSAFVPLSCSYGDRCHAYNTDQEHGGAGNMVDAWGSGMGDAVRDPAERAKVPAELSAAIRDACERALDGAVPEQTSLAEVRE